MHATTASNCAAQPSLTASWRASRKSVTHSAGVTLLGHWSSTILLQAFRINVSGSRPSSPVAPPHAPIDTAAPSHNSVQARITRPLNTK
jgi:hypothetical protein